MTDSVKWNLVFVEIGGLRSLSEMIEPHQIAATLCLANAKPEEDVFIYLD